MRKILSLPLSHSSSFKKRFVQGPNLTRAGPAWCIPIFLTSKHLQSLFCPQKIYHQVDSHFLQSLRTNHRFYESRLMVYFGRSCRCLPSSFALHRRWKRWRLQSFCPPSDRLYWSIQRCFLSWILSSRWKIGLTRSFLS